MNGQEAFRRLANQLRSTGGGGGPIPGRREFFTGSGLLIALIGGGLVLNSSLFNGAVGFPRFTCCVLKICYSGWWSPCHQI